MENSSPFEVVYRGEVIHTEFDPDDLASLEERLEGFVDLDPGEQLHVSLTGNDRLTVQKLRVEE